MDQKQNKCNVCHKAFSSQQELHEHQKSAHGGSVSSSKKEGERSGSEQHPREHKIAS